MEFAVARALASLHDPEAKVGPFRVNLEGVDWRKRYRVWAEKDRATVWNAADLATNLSGVLQRRLMDGVRAGCEALPLGSHFTVPLEPVAAFVAGDLDEQRIEDLIWGLMLIDDRGHPSRDHGKAHDLSVPRAYALLKLLFLPRRLVIERGADGEHFAHLLRKNEPGGVLIRPEPSILPLLRGGRLGEACAIAMRRLRASGLGPMPSPIRGGRVRDQDWQELDRVSGTSIDPQRLAAALLIPIRYDSVSRLVHRVIGRDERGDDQAETGIGMNFKGGTLS
jgi:CRISPR-associated protein Csx17